jgi:intracellular multiplication protein IcmD
MWSILIKLVAFLYFFNSNISFANVMTLGTVASNITANFVALTQLITSFGYVAGVMCMVIAIFQFKQHKENPSQTPLSKPMMILAMATALIFLPSITEIANGTFFGTNGGIVAGPNGYIVGV